MQTLEEALADPNPLTRARRFDDLGLRGADTRPGIGLRDGLPDLLWRRVPAGRFWMGGDPLALGAWPGRLVDLPSSLFMAAYPVTVSEQALHRPRLRNFATRRTSPNPVATATPVSAKRT